MKKLLGALFLFHCLLQQAILPAQTATPDSLRLERSLPVTARFATTDNLGNLYLISPKNILEKYAPDNRLLSRYSNNRLGTAVWLDVTNPLKVLVWYADFRTVVFLDRNFTQTAELNLISAGYPEVRTVAAAADGNMWLYDEVAFQLKKISPDGQTRFESQALNLIQADRLNIHTIRDNGREVFAAEPDQGILCFDNYAQYQRTLDWKNIASFTLEGNQLSYCRDSSLHLEQLPGFVSRQIALPASARQAGAPYWLSAGRLLVQNGALLEIWTWN